MRRASLSKSHFPVHSDTSSPEASCALTPPATICHACAFRLVVGAPLEVVAVNQTGRLYDCVAATGLCQPIPLHSEWLHPRLAALNLPIPRFPSYCLGFWELWLSPPNEGMAMSVIMCTCPLSTPRCCEHVPGSVPVSRRQSPLAAGEFPSHKRVTRVGRG